LVCSRKVVFLTHFLCESLSPMYVPVINPSSPFQSPNSSPSRCLQQQRKEKKKEEKRRENLESCSSPLFSVVEHLQRNPAQSHANCHVIHPCSLYTHTQSQTLKMPTNVPTNHIHEEDIKHTRCRFSQYARREEDRLKTHDTLRRKPHEYAQFPNCNVKTKVKEEKEEKKTPPITERSNPAKYDTVGHAKKKKRK